MSLATLRQKYAPKIVPILKQIENLELETKDALKIAEPVLKLFPHLNPKILTCKTGKKNQGPLNIGIVLSGGPAAGGHNVITGVFDALQKWGGKLIGFLNGPAGIVENRFLVLDQKSLDAVRNTGGFSLLGTGRTKIETEEQFAKSLETAQTHALDGLIIVGGDDSNTNAALLAEYFLAHGSKTAVIGVPKTIDGDLQNQWIDISFGFDSAAKTYSELIGNILSDAVSQGKYTFFIKVMGRTASHLVLECALKTHPHLALIGEEIAANQSRLADVVGSIADLICERAKNNKLYSVILIPEGVIEFIPEVKKLLKELSINQLSAESSTLFNSFSPEIQRQLTLERDPHGNINVSKIETERLLIALVQEELKKRNFNLSKFSPQPLFFGYEGRSCLPSNFDADYCYNLGLFAALLAKHHYTGYMATLAHLAKPVDQWIPLGVPLIAMIDLEERKGASKPVIKKGLVDLKGPAFKAFTKNRLSWRLQDSFLTPGPIQFFGPSEITDGPPAIIQLQ